ncbi:hypothetical protein ABLE91_06555 [Aquabacter sp. CN5-332]|uniref:hypothetical protein n=1 Tax=Aquabacter sp. CN5-332 TaxID=3156608 RepID=UPI0032B32EBA
MYAVEWHKVYSDKTAHSARTILPDLMSLFQVRSLLEVGCGNAHWAQAAIHAGVEDCLAVDGPWNKAEELLIDPQLYRVRDLSESLNLERRFDMSVCLEVAEHLDGAFSDILVNSLTASADIVLFSAAIPLQGGYRHVNEQWPSWWQSKFSAAGFDVFDLVRPKHWLNRDIHYWYRQNTFVYVRRDNRAKIDIATDAQRTLYASPILLDAVHPEKYERMASYDAIAGKRLARELPGWVFRRLRTLLRL